MKYFQSGRKPRTRSFGIDRPSVHDPVERCSRSGGIRVHHPVEALFTIAWNTQYSRVPSDEAASIR